MKKSDTLKALYLKELENNSTWRNDPSMIKYCINKASVIVNLPSGWIYVINKPHIETRFCFGYWVQGHDYEVAQEIADSRKEDVKAFLRENLQGLDDMIKDLEEAKENDGFSDWSKLYILDHKYNWDLKECNIKEARRLGRHLWYDFKDLKNIANRFGSTCIEASKEDITAILNGYKEARDLFMKRLQTYLKKFGLSKIHTWTYWADE